jgi:hypothetical protein
VARARELREVRCQDAIEPCPAFLGGNRHFLAALRHRHPMSDPSADDDQPLDPAAARIVAKVRWLTLIAGATTLLAVSAVIGVIGYRLFTSRRGAGPLVEILDDLTTHIIHPYGTIGELQRPTCPGGLPFGGGAILTADYVELARGIKTYTEQTAAADLLAKIEAEMQGAECIVFLGFAYHSQNMQLLRPSKATKHKPVFGTAFMMSDADTEVVSDHLSQLCTPNMSKQQRLAIIRLETS